MSVNFPSRRSFLKMSSLLVAGIALTPAMALVPNLDSVHSLKNNKASFNRSDIRSLDFDSHEFLLNFKRGL